MAKAQYANPSSKKPKQTNPRQKTKSVPSPTGRPSKVRSEIKNFGKGSTSGGSRTSSYSAPKKTAKKAAKRKYGMDAPARRREKKAGL